MTAASTAENAAASSEVLAAIDMGSNSFHMVVARLVHGEIRTLEKMGEKVQLGAGLDQYNRLTEDAQERALACLGRFAQRLKGMPPEAVQIVGTNALRVARNAHQFMARAEEALGYPVEIIAGREEARLIYLGVLSGMSFGDRPHLLLDIGGGSTELILADGRDARALTSTRVGAVRLQRDFVKDDPIPPQRRSFLQAFIQGSLEPAVDKVHRRIKPGEIPVLVATSGTAMAIGALAAIEDERPPLKLHGYRVSRQRLDRVVEKLVTMAKDPSQHNRRRAFSKLRSKDGTIKLFDVLGPRFAERPGGYCRIIKLAKRRLGDNGERAILEFVERTPREEAVAEPEAAAE